MDYHSSLNGELDLADRRQRTGTTGVREAVATTELFAAGPLAVETYESSWAQDPYDRSYQDVDRSTLRYMSDGKNMMTGFRIIR